MGANTMLVTSCVLLVVAMVTGGLTCSTPLSSVQFTQLYCAADVVFRGVKVGGSSGLAWDAQGRQIQGAHFIFQVSQVYKGPAGTSRLSVSRIWTEGVDHCPAQAFPDTSSDLLVFSSAGTVQTCRHSFPWSCVPDSFKHSLPDIAC